MNRIIMEKVRSMLSNSRLENNFWEETVRIACYLINWSPTTTLDGGIPEEVWMGKKVNYTDLKNFGCESFVHIPKEDRTKLGDKSMKCIFLEYADGEVGLKNNKKISHHCKKMRSNFKNTIGSKRKIMNKKKKKLCHIL